MVVKTIAALALELISKHTEENILKIVIAVIDCLVLFSPISQRHACGRTLRKFQSGNSGLLCRLSKQGPIVDLHLSNMDVLEKDEFLKAYRNISAQLKKKFIRRPNVTDAVDGFGEPYRLLLKYYASCTYI